MIHGVSANKSTFNTVSFNSGLNVIVTERTEESTEKDSGNELGKSRLIEIIDFCLGSQQKHGSGLLIEPLRDWEFTLEISIFKSRVKVTRSVHEHEYVVIEGETSNWNPQPEIDENSGKKGFKIDKWCELLGRGLFNLDGIGSHNKYRPNFRSLVPYFIRLGHNAYSEPFKYFPQQSTWDIQLHIAYLLGLNWNNASSW